MRTFAGHQGHSEWVKKTRAGIISDCSPSYHTLHLLFFYFSLRDERPFILRGKVLATFTRMANAGLVKLEKSKINMEKFAYSAILKPAKGLKCMETKKEAAKTKIVVICI